MYDTSFKTYEMHCNLRHDPGVCNIVNEENGSILVVHTFGLVVYNIASYQAVGLAKKKGAIRLDLANHGSRVEKARVGPFGSDLFDSAISVTSGSE